VVVTVLLVDVDVSDPTTDDDVDVPLPSTAQPAAIVARTNAATSHRRAPFF
jgi:hypothetical protein